MCKFGFNNNYLPTHIQNCNIGIAMIHLSGISSRGINCIETHDWFRWASCFLYRNSFCMYCIRFSHVFNESFSLVLTIYLQPLWFLYTSRSFLKWDWVCFRLKVHFTEILRSKKKVQCNFQQQWNLTQKQIITAQSYITAASK